MNVIVTGGGRGIGRAIALAYGRENHNVLVNFRTRRAEAEEVAAEIRALGADAETFGADVADPAQARAMVNRALEKWGVLDVLVNNAGITRDRLLLKMSPEEWREVVDVNLSGTFWCLQAAAEAMAKRREGCILNVASMLGVRGGFGCANYAASKAGVIGLTKAAARELGRHNIRVNALLPGYHKTEMTAALTDEDVQRVTREHVLGRTPDAAELGHFVVVLSGQKSVSGQVFNFESRVI